MLAEMLSRKTHSEARQGGLPQHPSAGVVMHFTSLPSPYGIGDIGDAAQLFLQQLSAMGIAVWQFLPTGPTAYGDSPYQPLSAFAGNEMLVGLEPLVRACWLRADELQALEGLDQGSVDYGALITIKHKLLMLAAERFGAHATARQQAEYAAFVEQNRELWLDAYVEYRLLKSLHEEKPWPEWDVAFVGRETAAMAGLRQQHSQRLQQLRVMQFFFQQQWQALHDLADSLQIRLFG
ncbi:MAG TPA: 4-alpha-glucanotransferase, partial [Xanthomonadales bacterium]|nr:4-alpha-glucanotransferase [Xanthomonadales bacterium]